MGCTEGLARILMFVANFCFLLVGLAMLVVGILYKINYHKYDEAIPDQYQVVQYVPTIAIIIGAIIFVIAFLGCCGTLKSSTCMLTSYGAILFIIFLLQVGLGIFALVTIKNNDELRQEINKGIENLFGRYDSDDAAKESVDIIQKTLNCCGTKGSQSWILSGLPIPESCSKESYLTGCEGAMYDFILSSVKLIGIIALTVSVVEVVGAVLALCLSNCIRGRERQGAYY